MFATPVQSWSLLADVSNTFRVGPGDDPLGFLGGVLKPMLMVMEVTIPIAVGVHAIHRLMQHETSGVGFFVDLLVKGGGIVLIVIVIEKAAGL